MKAIVYDRYGSPDVLRLAEVERPRPGDRDVLVKVHAASVNSWDWDLVTGKPRIFRLLSGLRRPKHPVIGSDVAGTVEAVGAEVTGFRPGDEVFGDISGCGFGAFAEYARAREDVLALKPAGMTFEQAAAIPQAAVLALQGLRQGRLQSGQHVLINGAGGGVGTFALQMAKAAGAEVTGVDRASKLDLLRALGADHVVDYAEEDFTRGGTRYDLVLDVVARRSAFACKRALSPGGGYVVVGGAVPRILQFLLLGPWIAKATGKRMGLLMHRPDKADLESIAALFEAGQVEPVIDKSYALSEVPAAMRDFGEGHIRGKAVIAIHSGFLPSQE